MRLSLRYVTERLAVFTDRYPLLGPLIWMLSIHYFLVQWLTAASWSPGYSWRFNTISDLGSTACGSIDGRMVCSPLHALMNGSFLVLGMIMAGGSLLIYQEFRKGRATLLGFGLMGVAGIGSVLVGLFPENTVPVLHLIGAGLPFLLGNVSLLVLGVAVDRAPLPLRIYTCLSGFVPLIALGFFVSHHYGGIGIGGVERLVAYPQTVWLVAFGAYTSRSHWQTVRLWLHRRRFSE